MRLYDHPYKLLAAFMIVPTILFLVGLFYTDIALVPKAYIKELEFLSGAWCWAIACFLFVTAIRPRFVEKWGSLDSYYHCHKILGIACTILSILHFYSKDIGIALMPVLFTFPEGAQMPPNSWPLASFTHFAQASAHIFSVLALIFIVCSFIPQIRYSVWLKMHRILAVVAIIICMHVLILLRDNQVITPLGVLTIAMTLVTLYAAVISLLDKSGQSKRFAVTLQHMVVGNNYLKLTLRAAKLPKGEKLCAGHFVFLRLQGYNAHPYTVQSVQSVRSAQSMQGNGPNTTFTLLIKRGGIFAKVLEEKLQDGMELNCEGPYGLFALPLPTAEQHDLWLGQGVGMSALYDAVMKLPENANKLKGRLTITLLTRNAEQDEVVRELSAAYDKLDTTQKEQVQLIVHDSATAGRITPQRLTELCSGVTSLYFCGDSKLKYTAKQSFMSAGGSATNFHGEYAQWR